MAGTFVPERQIPSVQGAVITSLSGMTWTSLSGPQVSSEGTNLPTHRQRPLRDPHTQALQGLESVWAGRGTDATRVVPTRLSSCCTSQTPGEALSLALRPEQRNNRLRGAQS